MLQNRSILTPFFVLLLSYKLILYILSCHQHSFIIIALCSVCRSNKICCIYLMFLFWCFFSSYGFKLFSIVHFSLNDSYYYLNSFIEVFILLYWCTHGLPLLFLIGKLAINVFSQFLFILELLFPLFLKYSLLCIEILANSLFSSAL